MKKSRAERLKESKERKGETPPGKQREKLQEQKRDS